jgi:hypothetical protein
VLRDLESFARILQSYPYGHSPPGEPVVLPHYACPFGCSAIGGSFKDLPEMAKATGSRRP